MQRRSGDRHLLAGLAALGIAVAGCSSAPPARPAGAPSPGGTPARTTVPASPGGTAIASPAGEGMPAGRVVPWPAATSAAAGGGMSALIAAARKEGTLTVIALLPGWANYATIIRTFSRKYGIRVRSVAPGDTSAQEIAQIRAERGTGRAADVLDVDLATAVAHASLFAPYKVATWAAIPPGQKAPGGAWAQDYGRYMSVGYDAARFGAITSLRQLLGPRFRGAVALSGNPAQASAALYGVMMASLAEGGSPSDVAAGVRFFRRLAAAGNYLPVPGNPFTIRAGSTPVVINWDYLNTAPVTGLPAWKVFIPPDATLGDFYVQAISKDAPHPAAARLWEEFLYSQAPGGGQNRWLEAGLRPVEEAAMTANKTIDAAAAAKLPPITGTPVFLTPGEVIKAARYLAANWARAVG